LIIRLGARLVNFHSFPSKQLFKDLLNFVLLFQISANFRPLSDDRFLLGKSKIIIVKNLPSARTVAVRSAKAKRQKRNNKVPLKASWNVMFLKSFWQKVGIYSAV